MSILLHFQPNPNKTITTTKKKLSRIRMSLGFSDTHRSLMFLWLFEFKNINHLGNFNVFIFVQFFGQNVPGAGTECTCGPYEKKIRSNMESSITIQTPKRLAASTKSEGGFSQYIARVRAAKKPFVIHCLKMEKVHKMS